MADRPEPRLRAQRFTESVIREMTRLAAQHGAINLAQGFPDFPAPQALKDAAAAALQADFNQYAITWGARSLRQALAEKLGRDYGMAVGPERQSTGSCGAPEALGATPLAVLQPGHELLLFQPCYGNYRADLILAGGPPPPR